MPVENTVDEIKQKLDIVTLISRYVPLKKRGRHFVACCPFHQEKTPSFIVSPELQIFKCFGCGKAGDIFTFIQEYERIDFREALEDLAKMAGVTIKTSPQYSQQDSLKKTLYRLNAATAHFYHYVLTSHPLGKSALTYVKDRGITSATLRQFKIGFSPTNSHLLVNYLLKKGFSKSDLIASGTFGQSRYRQNDFYDRFQGRLVFPLYDYRGQIQGFSGRVLPGSSKVEAAKYINSPETEIYHKSYTLYGLNLSKEAIRKADAVIVTEGEFDMISPFQAGIQNIVAIKGTAFTKEQLQLLRRYAGTLILALDSDFAGSAAARRSIELADELEFDIQVLTLGDKYKDPDEAIKADPDFFKKRLQSTVSVWDFVISSALKTYDPDTVKGKKDILALALPFLSHIRNSVIRSDYLRRLAADIGSDYPALLQEANKYQSVPADKASAAPAPTSKSTPEPPPDKTVILEEYLLSLIFSAKKPHLLAKKLESYLSEFVLSPKYSTIISHLLTVSKFDPKNFEQSLPAEIQPGFQELYISAVKENIASPQRHRLIKSTLSQIGTIRLRSQLDELSARIARLESGSDDTTLAALEKDYNALLARLSRIQSAKF